MTHRIVAAVMCACLLVTSCTRAVHVPASSDGPDLEVGKKYRVETTDGQVYVTNHLERNDRGVVIHTVRQQEEKPRPHSFFVDVDPISVPFEEVASIETTEISASKTLWCCTIPIGVYLLMMPIMVGANLGD